MVEVIVQIVTGDIDQSFGLGVFLDESRSYGLSGSKTRRINGDQGQVTVSGSFEVEVGVLFEFGISLNLEIQYSLFDGNPSFDYFKISVSGGTEFDAYATVTLSGSIELEYKSDRLLMQYSHSKLETMPCRSTSFMKSFL